MKVSYLPQLSSTLNKGLIQDMEKNIGQLLNQTTWTKQVYQPGERIQCDINLHITAVPALSSYTVSAQLLLVRPIYGTSYQTVLFSHTDTKWQFEYLRGQPLRYIQGASLTEITGLLTFYVYLMLGIDADSFSPLGGSPHFEQAQRIIGLVPSSNVGGWSQFGDQRNRYWLIDNFLDPKFADFRVISYEYHRKGMDLMEENAEQARLHIFDQLMQIKDIVHGSSSFILSIVWIDSKYRELISIFSKGPKKMRTEAFEALKRINPTRTEKYAKILEGN